MCLLCTRLRNSYGNHAHGGACVIKNKRALDIPSLAVTRRLLAAARIWLMISAVLDALHICIPPRYVERLRAQFVQMFVDFGYGGCDHDRDGGGKWNFPSCPANSMQNIEIDDVGFSGQVPAIIFPGGPNFHRFREPLMRPRPVWTSDDVPDDEPELSDEQ